MKLKQKQYFKVGIQIFLMVCFTIAISYFAERGMNTGQEETQKRGLNILERGFLFAAKIMTLILGDGGLVSALDSPVATCIESKNGSICQEYDSSQCSDRCKGVCIPSSRDKVAECKLGTCYDQTEGTCSPRSVEFSCSANGGQWFNDANGNIPECRKGCCTHGGGTFWTTEQTCARMALISGQAKQFDTSIRTDYDCYLSAKTQEEGACRLAASSSGSGCVFTTRADCMQKRGEFFSGFLCTYPEINSNCTKQAKSGCYDGREDVYWFDSCNNRENIYDADKVKSWNGGKVMSESESCTLGTSSNPLANQGTCGNCDYIANKGSKCGAKAGFERLDDPNQNSVCRSLACVDSKGNKRANGESWCVYSSSVGLKNGIASSAVGSESMKQACVDGVVINETCAPRRNGICTEDVISEDSGKQKSTAACRPNLAELCINYNTETDKDKMKEKCEKNPDCFLNHIAITDTNFNFDVCEPKYPIGSSQTTNTEYTESLCGLATVDCVATRLKTFGSVDWYNAGCLREEFTKKMNDFCMSLGDCGAKVNYAGDLGSDGYKAKKFGVPLSTSSLNSLKVYSSPVAGEVIPGADVESFYGAILQEGEGNTIPAGLNDVNFPDAPLGWEGAMGIGSAGMLIAGLAKGGVTAAGITGLKSGLAAGGGAFAGAAVGAAVVLILMDLMGIGAGMPEWLTYSLIAMGAVAGGIIGYGIMVAGTASTIWPIGWIIAGAMVFVIVVTLVVGWLTGVGKKKEYPVRFECRPWTPPIGGDKCSQCGKIIPCTAYSCEALGTQCELVNEGTSNQACVNVPSDPFPPKINPLQGVLPEGFSYSNVSENGFRIQSLLDDGCIPAFTRITFGLALNEYGKCTYRGSSINRDSLLQMYDITEAEAAERGLDLNAIAEEMNIIGTSGVYRINHTQAFTLPSLESLGISSIDPSKRFDFNMFVTCEDKGGHKNEADYIIKSCLRPQRDISAPRIQRKEPLSGYVKADAADANISIYTNEPANCSWDMSDKEYGAMTNNFNCNNAIASEGIYGWKCSGIVPIGGNETNVSIRCKDKPWLEGINESDRNANDKSENFRIRRSAPLVINSITPDNRTFYSANEPTTVEVQVKTSGGVDNGNARCGYLIPRFGNSYQDFGIGFGTSVQGYIFDQMIGGDWTMGVRCEDSVGNVDIKTAKFSVVIDRTAPVITKFYARGGVLTVKTNEKSSCAFSTQQCAFNFENGTLMTGADYDHTSGFVGKGIMYIMCRDSFKNTPGSCSLTIRNG